VKEASGNGDRIRREPSGPADATASRRDVSRLTCISHPIIQNSALSWDGFPNPSRPDGLGNPSHGGEKCRLSNLSPQQWKSGIAACWAEPKKRNGRMIYIQMITELQT